MDVGTVPTPALALEALRRKSPAIMVTGSHIPADRNGLKFYSGTGEIGKDDEVGIVASLGEAPDAVGRATPDPKALRSYVARYAGMLPAGALKGWRIGIWQHSSVLRDVLIEVLDHFGADVVPLGRSDVFVPVDTEAVDRATARMLEEWVYSHQLDALVSTDGDADRPLLMDEKGALLRGDTIGILTARFLRADAVVTPVTSNSSIEASGYFGHVVLPRWAHPT